MKKQIARGGLTGDETPVAAGDDAAAAMQFKIWLKGLSPMIWRRVSSAFVEATVNAVVSKRFAKKQQMQWTRNGAHLLMQTRPRTLDGTLRSTFERWYPGMANDNADHTRQARAA